MNRSNVHLVLACGLLAIGAARCASAPPDKASVSHEGVAAAPILISMPVVNAPGWEYPNVAFQPGDIVTLNAGGCVQTGGAGNTWKRYVDPSGPPDTSSPLDLNPYGDADRLYRGTVFIPGATMGYVRLAGVIGKRLTIPSGIPSSMLHLSLGYEDSDYSDNGYGGHDDGNPTQCSQANGQDGGPAWVTVTIEHGPAPRDASGQTGYLPFDMWWSHSDPNGFPITPDWSQRMLARPDTTPVPTLDTCNHFRHVASGVSLTDKSGQPCASYEAGIDTPNSVATIVACKPNSGIGIEGHINIGVATYYGWLSGGDHTPRSSDINPNNWGDDDYNLDLHTTFDDLAATPFETAGVFGAQTAHKLEFEAHETVDVFWSSWWSQTHANVDSGSWASFDGNYAVVTGLIGIDNVHQGQAEIHPVYAMAIRLPPSTDATLEQWALFIRDSGTEGGCGHDDEHHDVRFPGGQFTFKLPWHPGMARAAVDSGGTVIEYIDPSGSRLATRPTSVASTPDSDGLLVTFDGFHQGSPMVDGVLALRWTPCTADVANDPRNCGRCGHVCKGAGVCAAGTCASPAPPGAALKVVCDGALGVQIASSAPAAGNDGAPLSIVFRRGPSATGPWTDLTAYAPGPRLFVDAPLPGAPSPWTWAVPTFYEVCIKDSAQQESCSTSSTEVPVNETLTSCPNGCTDLQSDPNNCGTCGHYCPFGCYQAQCMTAPPPPPTGQKCGSQRCAANKQCCQDPQGGTYYCAQKCM